MITETIKTGFLYRRSADIPGSTARRSSITISCSAVAATLHGESDGFIRYITDEIAAAIGEERDPLRACEKNVLHAVGRIRHEFAGHPEIENVSVRGAVYDVLDGSVRFVD